MRNLAPPAATYSPARVRSATWNRNPASTARCSASSRAGPSGGAARSGAPMRSPTSLASCACTSPHSRMRRCERNPSLHHRRCTPLPPVARASAHARQSRSSPAKSPSGCRHRVCAASASCSCPDGRSRGSCTDSAAAITSASSRHPSREASNTMRERRGSIGSRAICRPVAVRRRCASKAPSSISVDRPSSIARGDGGSMNGNDSGAPSPSDSIWSRTLARLVRRISGSGHSGRRDRDSSS